MDAAPLLFIGLSPSDTFDFRARRPSSEAGVLGRTAVRPYPRTSHCAPFETLSTHNKPL